MGTLETYEQVIASLPNVERKGAKLPYTSVNGHMFSQLTDDGQIAVRLPEDEARAFIAKHATANHVAHGAVRLEYVLVPAALLAKPAELKKLFARSYAFVSALKPKPTTRKKK